MSDTLAAFAVDLESLMAGRLSEADLRARYPASRLGELGETIWRGLDRFLADRSRRETDAEYAHMQLGQMRRLIRLLDDGGSEAEIAAITFAEQPGMPPTGSRP